MGIIPTWDLGANPFRPDGWKNYKIFGPTRGNLSFFDIVCQKAKKSWTNMDTDKIIVSYSIVPMFTRGGRTPLIKKNFWDTFYPSL